MIAAASVLKNNLLGLKPTMDKTQGLTNLVSIIANYVDQVQGGSLGTVGIFTFTNSAMVSALSSLTPVNDNSWVSTFTNAFRLGCAGATISSSTVTNVLWLGSTSLDSATLPTGATTITTLSAAISSLTGQLNTVKPDQDSPLALSTAIHDAILSFKFNCIGLGVGPAFTPIPVLTSAQ